MFPRLFAISSCLLILAACTTKHYRQSADKEVARILKQKTPLVPNMDTNFTIEFPTNALSLEKYPIYDKSEEAFGAERDLEKGARLLSLDDALEIAITRSRSYQNRKEQLYINTLTLTLERYRYTPIFRADISADVAKVSGKPPLLDVNATPRMDLLLRTGGRLATDFSLDFTRFLTGDPGVVNSSVLGATLTQPLLRGAGYKIATERLTQAERNLLYSLREFTRYRKAFVVEIASAYYSVLQDRDTVRNNWRGLENFKRNVARERAFFDEGFRSQASLDQLKQAELQTESRWINAVRTYRQSLDAFKLALGLNTDARIVLNDQDLEDLKIAHPTLGVEEAMNVAMVSRLDLDTQRDEVEDAQRHVTVAANGLLPDLTLSARGEFPGTPGKGFPSPDFRHPKAALGLNLGAPFDRKAERNIYRTSLIDLERSKRDLVNAVDTIRLQIADDWRNLDQAKRNYEISDIGVQIAQRRVEEQQLRQELGRGTSRDLVDAQNDLIDSKNQRTAALVNHTISRLRFYRDMGVLWVKDNGQWDENPAARNETNP